MEAYEAQIEGEWGTGRSLRQLEEEGELAEEIVNLRAAIKEAEKPVPFADVI